jgi:hypothetical protein
MPSYDWKDTDTDCQYYYDVSNGKIVGQIHKIAHTKVWVSKVVFNYNEEKYLGQFISSEYSKKEVERYWRVQGMTLIEGE